MAIDEKKMIEAYHTLWDEIGLDNEDKICFDNHDMKLKKAFRTFHELIDDYKKLSLENKTSDNRKLIDADDLLKAMEELNHSLQGARYYFAHIENWIRSQPKLDVPDNNVEKMNREFEGLEVNYLPDEFCIYPEYMGKPYFAIKYKENGNHFVGYGTYKPEVLSRYLRDNFMSSADSQSPKWIPCSEMLPDVWKSVLVTSGHLGVPDIRIAFVNENLEWASIWSSCEPDILAWMPLPDPYKGELNG